MTVIINPIAGVRPKHVIPGIVREVLPSDVFDVDIRFTEYAGHASEIAQEAVRNGDDSVVAIGGDGTINETAKSLIGSSTALGIVPMGSGNGLARHIQIPLELSRALEVVRVGHREMID
ncbi:MAG: acylglycerol kinase family protein, partial [Bacteroidales bacterium]|nr:acylglycerol kinase family protein [Bacteroidales bacterium]